MRRVLGALRCDVYSNSFYIIYSLWPSQVRVIRTLALTESYTERYTECCTNACTFLTVDYTERYTECCTNACTFWALVRAVPRQQDASR